MVCTGIGALRICTSLIHSVLRNVGRVAAAFRLGVLLAQFRHGDLHLELIGGGRKAKVVVPNGRSGMPRLVTEPRGPSKLGTEGFAVDECEDPIEHAFSAVQPVPVGGNRGQGDRLLHGIHPKEISPVHGQ